MNLQRPATLAEVARMAQTLSDFGYNLRDWQHEIQRGGVHSRPELSKRISEEPERLHNRFPEGDVADATLAAYAEWIADQAGIPRPEWCRNQTRVAERPWFGTPARGWLLANSPASFRHRNLFTIPEPVFTARPGRPPVSKKQKAEKAKIRQKNYRQRVRKLLEHARAD